MNEIIISPEWQKMQEEVERLKTSLSMIVMERDELLHVVCRNLESKYMMKLGELEYRVYKAMCECMRMKRKCELIQAAVNHGKKPDMTAIDEQLDYEFLEYTAELEAKMRKMNEAIEHHHGRILSEKETKELKSLYRKIVKRLHPDLHPEVTDEQLRLYQNAVEAYRHGDIDTLRIIDALCEDCQEGSIQEYSPEERKAQLLSAIKRVQEEIEAIKQRFPYTERELLEDPDKIEQRRKELKKEMDAYDSQRELYEESIRNRMS
ncbi:MAG: hypothetical protein IKE36_01415 [Solobacterium sp.]|nr:hypothetical protein [Solobacterium sp.]